MTGAGVIACTVDENPALHLEVLRWFATLTRIAEVAPEDLCVNVVGDGISEVLSYVEERGVRLLPAEPFDARWPHCNKINGAKAVASLDFGGVAVLTDADTAFVADPRLIDLPLGAIGGRTVDAPNPPLERLQNVYAQAGLELPDVRPAAREDEPTIVPNLNGGFLVVHHQELGRVSEAWARWADWLLDSGVLGDPPSFADQVATALAVTDLRFEIAEVGDEWNLATHMRAWNTPPLPTPVMVHYHRHLTPDGLIAPIGIANVDRVIERMNVAVAAEFALAFPTRSGRGIDAYLPATGSAPPSLARRVVPAVKRRLRAALGARRRSG